MIADRVIAVGITPPRQCVSVGLGLEFFIEDPVTQMLSGINVARPICESDSQAGSRAEHEAWNNVLLLCPAGRARCQRIDGHQALPPQTGPSPASAQCHRLPDKESSARNRQIRKDARWHITSPSGNLNAERNRAKSIF